MGNTDYDDLLREPEWLKAFLRDLNAAENDDTIEIERQECETQVQWYAKAALICALISGVCALISLVSVLIALS